MLLTIIYFIFILGVTVFIHELGHFLFAKKFGVYVYEFSLGMGPRLFKFNRKNDETDYCIRLFPIGGYVQMAGEEVEIDEKIPKEKRLQSKKWYQRLLIMVAGVMNNFILAIVVLFIVGLVNGVTLDSRFISESTVQGLNDGAKIIKINGRTTNNYDKLALELAVVNDNDFSMTVLQDGKKKNVKIHPIAVSNNYLLSGYDYGFTVENLTVSNSTNSKIKNGYKIKAVNGIEIKSYHTLISNLEKIANNGDKVVNFTFLDKNDNEKNVSVKIKKESKKSFIGYDYGFDLTGKHEHNILVAFLFAFRKFFSLIEQMFFTIVYLCTGLLSVKMLSGPVGIFNVVGQASSTGFINILFLLAIISINVGFINLLPIPAFDGGHVLFIIIEKIKGSPVNQKVENTIHTVFLVLLMILMLLITFNDVLKFF